MGKLNFDERVNQVERLLAFIEREKFSNEAWEELGLNPSDRELSETLELKFNECARNLIESINEGADQTELHAIIKTSLYKIDKDELDTEETEYVMILINELSMIVGIDIEPTCNVWYHGYVMSALLKVGGFLSELNKKIEEVSQKCTKCGSEIKLIIVRKDEKVPDRSYTVLECAKCGELNLFDNGPGIKQYRYENAQIITNLDKKRFTLEQAYNKMYEIKSK